MSLFDQEEDDNKDFLAELTGPGGKFDVAKYGGDREAAIKAIAKGKYYGDKTIEQRNKEFDELREEYNNVSAKNETQAKLDDLIAKYEKLSLNNSSTNTQVDSTEPKFDPEQLDQMLESKITAREAKKREEANVAEFEKRLLDRAGDNAKKVLRDRMKSLGFSDEDIKFLAKRSPEAAINALGLNQQSQDTFSPPLSSLRSDNFSPQADIRDALFYEKMRRENPKLYFSEKQSVQRLSDMESPDFLTRLKQRSGT